MTTCNKLHVSQLQTFLSYGHSSVPCCLDKRVLLLDVHETSAQVLKPTIAVSSDITMNFQQTMI